MVRKPRGQVGLIKNQIAKLQTELSRLDDSPSADSRKIEINKSISTKRDEIKDVLAKRTKLSLESLMNVLEDGLEAKETRFFAKDGIVTDERETPDHKIRHDYANTVLKLHGAFGKSEDDGQLNVNVGQMLNIINESRAERGLEVISQDESEDAEGPLIRKGDEVDISDIPEDG